MLKSNKRIHTLSSMHTCIRTYVWGQVCKFCLTMSYHYVRFSNIFKGCNNLLERSLIHRKVLRIRWNFHRGTILNSVVWKEQLGKRGIQFRVLLSKLNQIQTMNLKQEWKTKTYPQYAPLQTLKLLLQLVKSEFNNFDRCFWQTWQDGHTWQDVESTAQLLRISWGIAKTTCQELLVDSYFSANGAQIDTLVWVLFVF